MIGEHLSVLSGARLFRGLSESDIEALLRCLEPRVASYPRNECVAIEGEPLTSVGIVLCGTLTIYKENAAGNQVVLNVLRPGDTFGETAAFVSSPKWPATIRAESASGVLHLPPDRLIEQCQRLCPWHKALLKNLLGAVSERALLLNQKVTYLTIKSMRGKLSAYLLDLYKKTGSRDLVLPLNRNQMADFLNVSRPSMSREMCRMRDEGIIDFHLSNVRILDPERLLEGR